MCSYAHSGSKWTVRGLGTHIPHCIWTPPNSTTLQTVLHLDVSKFYSFIHSTAHRIPPDSTASYTASCLDFPKLYHITYNIACGLPPTPTSHTPLHLGFPRPHIIHTTASGLPQTPFSTIWCFLFLWHKYWPLFTYSGQRNDPFSHSSVWKHMTYRCSHHDINWFIA